MMHGPDIIARTLTTTRNHKPDGYGNSWQYHSRSDRHSKIACWAILFDLLRTSSVLRSHIAAGEVAFGINHQIQNFAQNKKKDLDLVLCRPAEAAGRGAITFADLASKYKLDLSADEHKSLDQLPTLYRAPVGSILIALEAKATMTAHIKAVPRLYDELNSSRATVHGHSEHAIAVGLELVNFSDRFVSADANKIDLSMNPAHYSRCKQPDAAQRVLDSIATLPRRSNTQHDGFDAFGVVGLNFANDGGPVHVATDPPAPQPGSVFHYDSLIRKMDDTYRHRFPNP